MGRITKIRTFYADFHPKNQTLRTLAMARRWIETAGVDDPAVAAAWANANYLPEEALPLIAQGMSPEQAVELEDITVDADGGPELHAMAVIDRLVDDGTLVDPARVRQRVDPDDPTHIIVDILPE